MYRIGGKEVQIIDMASESEKTEEKPIEQPVKKMKLNPTKQKSDFVLPPPPLEHQVRFVFDKLFSVISSHLH